MAKSIESKNQSGIENFYQIYSSLDGRKSKAGISRAKSDALKRPAAGS
jgi:hypothetical protein